MPHNQVWICFGARDRAKSSESKISAWKSSWNAC